MLAVQADLFAVLKAQHGLGHALAADLAGYGGKNAGSFRDFIGRGRRAE